ncbi:MAG: type II toxin-antitoxin system VapC family toxin [Alphaproteobacteria bacterium]|nr:type II toxin-antitoxin system VapC family toxin [Alphaproteobacteria bacterium]
MRLYLDTSVLVSALTDEAQTPRTQAWLGRQNSGSLAISEWVATEFSSALSIKLRAGQISVANRADALALFARLRAESFEFLPISGSQFRAAARFADEYALGLRAGDALHLAICADHGATFCTLDRRLPGAAAALGVSVTLL